MKYLMVFLLLLGPVCTAASPLSETDGAPGGSDYTPLKTASYLVDLSTWDTAVTDGDPDPIGVTAAYSTVVGPTGGPLMPSEGY